MSQGMLFSQLRIIVMAYTALYRKWRPTVFEDVKGQDAIVTTLKNQIRHGRIGHAYLFCGTRGTGKTTVAKILARAVNCENPQNGNACGECAACRAIASGASMNVVEIDAASNNGVDNVREIREEVQYSPAQGKYRVYIIDEVHMLSPGAFNALLKTLEEPPSYVIFILATTEPNRIPVTVLSRCQRYDFKRISTDTLKDRIRELADREGIAADDAALSYIARKADGGMRDAISLLDQCAAFYMEETLTYEKVLAVLGAVDNEQLSRMARSAFAGDVTALLAEIDTVVADGKDLSVYVQDLIWYLRNLLLVSTSGAGAEQLDISYEDLARLQEEQNLTDPNGIMRMIRILSETFNRMRNAANKRVLLEIAVMKIAAPETEEDISAALDRIGRLERKLAEGIVVRSAAEPQPKEAPAKQENKPPVVELKKADYDDLMLVKKNWKTLIMQVASEDYPSGDVLRNTRPEPREDGALTVVFFDINKYNISVRIGALDRLREQLQAFLKKEISVEGRAVREGTPEPVYRVVSDEDLAVFHMDIEETDDFV